MLLMLMLVKANKLFWIEEWKQTGEKTKKEGVKRFCACWLESFAFGFAVLPYNGMEERIPCLRYHSV